jgi:hypothetical protein
VKKTATLHRLGLNTIINIAEKNGYKREKVMTLYKQIKTTSKNRNIDNKQQKWDTFTYTNYYICVIAKLFETKTLK